MFEIDHSHMPKGAEYRELRQFVNSMQLRSQAERLGCSAVTVVTCDYIDCQSGNQCQGHFIARKDSPDNPLFLISEKSGGKGTDLFRYQAVSATSKRGRWGEETVLVWELVH